ncbi:MAG: hypothetical protein J6B94_13210 [Lachnospiraceae bacterium]|nr:hypothetical protein [Lachnospiraceae bacterium]
MEKQKKLSSSASTQTSLEAIRNKRAGLTQKREKILSQAPNSGDWATFHKDTIDIKDLAYLAAKTGDEFALLRGKAKDIVFHGVPYHCHIEGELLELLKSKNLRLVAHTHPDYGEISPSNDDRDFLKYIGQKTSKIISSITGIEQTFSENLFDDI